MLILPTRGFSRSVQKHNVKLDILCDWIEGSVLFKEEEISVIDVVDVLIEEEVYTEQDFAHQMLMNAWTELQMRRRWIGDSCSFNIDGEWIRRNTSWEEVPDQAFCILLSLAPNYDWWTREFRHNYTEQGELFELLTKEALEAQFDSWQVYQTGWTRTNTPGLRTVVQNVANILGEKIGRIELWDKPNAKELGLDLLWYRQFPDNRIGFPIYLVQCASGGDWESKRHTPDLKIWRNVVQFTTMPKRAFSAPFSLLDTEFMQSCVIIDGLLIDRCRILCAYHYNENWISQILKERILDWARPRVSVLLEKSK